MARPRTGVALWLLELAVDFFELAGALPFFFPSLGPRGLVNGDTIPLLQGGDPYMALFFLSCPGTTVFSS